MVNSEDLLMFRLPSVGSKVREQILSCIPDSSSSNLRALEFSSKASISKLMGLKAKQTSCLGLAICEFVAQVRTIIFELDDCFSDHFADQWFKVYRIDL